jgi:hypothetical protein
LKRPPDLEERTKSDRAIRETVETILADIEIRGDAAVRDLSYKFDGWDRSDHRLTQAEVYACIACFGRQDINDIAFAQANALRRSTAHRRRRIRSTTIAPTFIETKPTQPFMEEPAFPAAVLQKIKPGRLGKVEDLMEAVVFLASPAAALITGTSLVVDGGWTED